MKKKRINPDAVIAANRIAERRKAYQDLRLEIEATIRMSQRETENARYANRVLDAFGLGEVEIADSDYGMTKTISFRVDERELRSLPAAGLERFCERLGHKLGHEVFTRFRDRR